MENRPRILICDDEHLMTESIRAVLDTGDYQVQTTNSSRHALTLIHAESPDLVILDVMMPEMNGFELLDAVDRDQCDSAFIIVTGEASIDSAIKAIRHGASDYLRKPFEPDELIIRVENVLKQRQMKQAHMCFEAEKRHLENQLRQSQKMEAIGTLAGGIAHDFNNVLSIILGNAELALAVTSNGHSSRQNIERILTASLRARDMIQQLLSFSRKEETGRTPISLNRVVSDSLKLIRASLPADIRIECDICEAECTAIADATQIHQIMLNLCTNAAHAMEPNGGNLTVVLAKIVLDGPATDMEGLTPGNYARLVVADTGRGIEKDIIDRIFDPYFTTKETGKGTGMGLSVVHGIINGAGGIIRVFSRPGRYTEFHIYLPLTDGASEAETVATDHQLVPGGREHILIVDDEAMLVDMTRELLEQLGYTVSAFTDSGDALKAFLACPKVYDLMITDMTMPGMTGIGLVKAVKAVRGDIPVILCTGYNEQISEANSRSLDIQAFLMKPVGMQPLAKTIRQVLLKQSTERRKSKRFTVPEGTFVVSCAHPNKPCKLVDIGMAGLSYRHDMEPSVDHSADQLALMTPQGDVFLSGVPCRNVSEVSADSGVSLPDAGQLRRSVRFDNLSMPQKAKIEQFINKHARAPIR